MRRLRFPILATLAILLGVAPAIAREEAGERGYYRQPSTHANTVVFVSEGDLWSVPATGGPARRLTTHPDMELHPAISPDGTRIAFSGRYEGPTEVYVMPIEGGRPTRLTYGAGRPRVVGWTPDGSVLYSTSRYSTLPDRMLVAVHPDTGAERVLPLAQADQGVFAPDSSLIFTRLPFQGSHAKRYQGGSVQQLWRWSGKDGDEAVALTADHPGTSKNPMVFQAAGQPCRVYFLTDRDGTMNVWSIALDDPKDLRQHTHHKFFDVREASLHAGKLVYRIGADLLGMDLGSGRETRLDIRLVTDADHTRRKWITDPMSFVTDAHASPDGNRAVLTSRGRVFVAPAEPGRLVELARQGWARNRTARFSHDGKAILYFSDLTDEVELWSRPADGSGEPKQLTKDGKALRNDLRPSPDGRFVAHSDLASGLYVTALEDGATRTVVGPGVHHGVRIETWSRDGRWLVFALERAEDFNHPVLVLWNAEDGSSVELTSHDYASHDAVFGPKGEWLYFLSERDFDSIARSPWGARQPEPHFDRQTRIYALALKPGLRPPFQEPDELWRAAEEAKKKAEKKKDENEKGDAKKGDAKKKDGEPSEDKKKPDEKKKPEPIEIDTQGLRERLVVLPVPAGRYDTLIVTRSHLLWRSSPGPFQKGKGGARRFDLQALKLGDEKAEVKTRLQDVGAVERTADGKKLLVRQGKGLAFVPADATAPIDPKVLKKGRVRLDGWRFTVDPRREWRQMYDDAWRMHRDYFYDPGMHGVDWPRMREVYRPLVDRVRDRDELQDLTGMLISELSALHASVRGGELRQGSDKVQVASLGARFTKDPEAGGYRLVHVYAHDPDRPELASPLARADLDVKPGDVLVAVDHRPVLPSQELGQWLVDRAGKQMLLTFRRGGRDTDLDVIVTPISGRAAWDLRYHAWQYTRRRATESLGDGRVGYIHLRGMGANDMAAFVRQYYPQFQREALIIDVRHNWGGNIDAWLLSRLMRKAWMYWQSRTGEPYANLRFAPRGHMIMLCDQKTASDGEAFSEGFRRLGLGPVLGMRTWGGEIWLHSGNRLADKGVASAGMFGVFGPAEDGSGMIWLVEGRGVEPDIVVDNLPHATFQGGDRQLDAAVRHLLEKLAKEPKPLPKPPPYPDKSHPNNR